MRRCKTKTSVRWVNDTTTWEPHKTAKNERKQGKHGFIQTIKKFLQWNGQKSKYSSNDGVSHLIHIIITMMLGTFPRFREK
jgi:hypothetical protein